MRYQSFPPLGRDLSRLVLGSMVFTPDDVENTYRLLDHWMEAGGNIVDTAHLYQGGNSERLLGRWLQDRNCRKDLTILTKAAHHNQDRKRVTPEDITCDLRDSLARLKTGYIDLYILHRDDPDVPVGEIVDVLNRYHREGTILAFGGSNWSPARLDAANEYAAAHGLQGFTASSPHYSLAMPKEEVWSGCLDARSPEDTDWYQRTQMPMFAWSSQARGFFTGRYTPENIRENEFLARVYDSPENWERYRRAQELGEQRGFQTVQVALAWVLHQPFPVFALVGPATVEEMDSSLAGLNLELTPEEVAWLDLR